MFIQTHSLTPAQRQQVEELERICKAKDRLSGSILTDSSDNFDPEIPSFFLLYKESIPSAPEDCTLICFLSLFLPEEGMAEVNAYTHPKYRRQHCFWSLLKAACHVLKVWNIPNVTFVSNQSGKGAHAVLKHLEASYAYSEYLMEFDAACQPKELPISTDGMLFISDDSQQQVLAQIHSEAFDIELADSSEFLHAIWDTPNARVYLYQVADVPVGLCCTIPFHDMVMVLGVGITASYQGQGYGYDMMYQLIQQITTKMCLHVSSYQAPAVSLYRKLGFSISEEFEYHDSQLHDIMTILSNF